MRAVLVRGLAGSTLVGAGGWCYARLPRQTWMDHLPVLWSVRHAHHHLAVGLVLSAGGLALLTWAWWDLYRGVRRKRVGLGAVRRATVLWAVPLLCAPPLFSGDGWSYVATGDLAGRGLSPYLWTAAALPTPLRSGVALKWLLTPSPYGPLSLAWGGAFARITHDPWALLEAYRGAAVLALVLLGWAVAQLARRLGRDPAEATVLAVASPFTLVHGIGGLHNDLAMAALALAALAVTRPGRWVAGAVLVGAATAVKVPGAVAALGVVLLSLGTGAGLLTRLWRTVLVGAVVAGVVLAAGWVTGLGTGWLGALSVPDHEHTVLSLSSLGGRWAHGILAHAGPGGLRIVHDVHPEQLAKQLGVVVLAGVAIWALLRTPAGVTRRAVAAAGVVMLAAVVLSPVVHYWYFLWCVPVLACLPLRRSAEAALVAGVVTLGLTAFADPALGSPWLWEGAAWALLLVPLLTWVLAAGRERSRSAPVAPGPPDRV